jgi:hypothetical protein
VTSGEGGIERRLRCATVAKGVDSKPLDSRAARAAMTAVDVRTDDWPAQATDAIVSVVGTAHDKITGPIRTVAKAIVWGLFAAVLGVVAAVLFVVFAMRLLDVYLPSSIVGDDHMWAAYGIVGVIFSLGGLYALRRARRPVAED